MFTAPGCRRAAIGTLVKGDIVCTGTAKVRFEPIADMSHPYTLRLL